jgi:hypothetical protein
MQVHVQDLGVLRVLVESMRRPWLVQVVRLLVGSLRVHIEDQRMHIEAVRMPLEAVRLL